MSSPHPRPLHGGGRLRELCLERGERAERRADRLGEHTGRLAAPVRRKVRPVHAVQHVAAEVEGEALLKPDDRVPTVVGSGGGELLERGVGGGHVAGVVLAVVQLDDVGAEVWFQRARVVGEVGKGVGHSVPLSAVRLPTLRPWPARRSVGHGHADTGRRTRSRSRRRSSTTLTAGLTAGLTPGFTPGVTPGVAARRWRSAPAADRTARRARRSSPTGRTRRRRRALRADRTPTRARPASGSLRRAP